MAMTFAEELSHVLRLIPTSTTVYEVEAGLPTLLAMAEEQNLFARFPWTTMALTGGPAEQVRALLRRRDDTPAFSRTAIWLTPTNARTFVRESSREAFASLVVGHAVTTAQMHEFCRAMYDVGIERLTGAIRKDHPYFTKAMDLLPEFGVEPHPRDPDSYTVVYPVNAATGQRP